MNMKAFFLCGGGLNLILGTGRENEMFFLRIPVTVKYFHQIVKTDTLTLKKFITYPDGFV